MLSLAQIKKHNQKWFSKGNKKFFGDVSYFVETGKSGKTYLIRSTYAWTDMFSGVKILHYRANPIAPETFDIEPLIDSIFKSRKEVTEWLELN